MSISASSRSVAATRARWQQELADSIRDVDRLCEILQLPREFRDAARDAVRDFPLIVPQSYVRRMQVGDPTDPLLRQILPLAEERVALPGFSSDPVGDHAAIVAPGLLQKYAGRALLIATGVCAVHCRYCFRRNFPYEQAPRRLEDWQPALQAIRADISLREILLSGGDPLTLTDERLALLLQELEDIPHLRRLRIHTRLPIVLPARMTRELLDRLQASRLTTIVVLHANHARELVHDAADCVRQLVRSGITVLNQAVLLNGINDTVTAQRDLCERLVDLGVIPYYLHQLDRVTGAAHFEVDPARGREIIAALRELLPGYAVPRYVQEVAGQLSKTPISDSEGVA